MDLLIQLLSKAKKRGQIKVLLKSLLTESELQEIQQRILILQMLNQGVSHHGIAAELEVGVATVTRGAKVLKSKAYQKIRDLI